MNKAHHKIMLNSADFIAKFNSSLLFSVKDKKIQRITYLVVSEDLDVGERVLVEDVLEVEVQLSLVRLHFRSNSKLRS